MKRSRHWVLKTLTALSLLVLPATAAMWWRGRTFSDGAFWFTPRMTFGVGLVSSEHSFSFDWITTSGVKMMLGSGFHLFHTDNPEDLLWQLRHDFRRPATTMGFGIGHSTSSWPNVVGSITTTRVVVPDWFVVSAAAMLPIIQFYRLVQSQRSKPTGLCVTCGYDLRATPERCPECGTIPTNTAEAKG